MTITPEQIRDLSWEQLQRHVTVLMLSALRAFREHGPGTTRQVAERARWDILNLRPRATDLYHLGFLEVVGREGREGVYRARTDEEVRRRIEAEAAALAAGDQMMLRL